MESRQSCSLTGSRRNGGNTKVDLDGTVSKRPDGLRRASPYINGSSTELPRSLHRSKRTLKLFSTCAERQRRQWIQKRREGRNRETRSFAYELAESGLRRSVSRPHSIGVSPLRRASGARNVGTKHGLRNA